jgi:hypothetical protein
MNGENRRRSFSASSSRLLTTCEQPENVFMFRITGNKMQCLWELLWINDGMLSQLSLKSTFCLSPHNSKIYPIDVSWMLGWNAINTRACWPSSARAWQDSMDISFGSMPSRPINAHVDKQEKLWTTFSFDVGNGPHTGQKCCNVPTLTEVTCPSSWEGNHPPMIKSGSRIWKPCEPQYDLRSLRADSRPPRLADKWIEYLFLLTPKTLWQTVDALQLPRIGCWTLEEAPSSKSTNQYLPTGTSYEIGNWNDKYGRKYCMGSKETRGIPKHACTGRLVIVALSAQPPGVNELCVCVCVCVYPIAKSYIK